jgi:ribosomal protein S18 acetylase RimI-like enzyme
VSSLLAPEVALRPVEPDTDRAFLARVYASTREEELAVVPWTPAQKEAFLTMQFDAQDAYWQEQRPHTERTIIVVDGRPAGRLYVDRTDDEIRIVDIALLPEFRGSGAGTALLRSVLDDGDRRGLPVTIHVEKGNRARGLYARLGFAPVSDAGAYDLYTHPPTSARDDQETGT